MGNYFFFVSVTAPGSVPVYLKIHYGIRYRPSLEMKKAVCMYAQTRKFEWDLLVNI